MKILFTWKFIAESSRDAGSASCLRMWLILCKLFIFRAVWWHIFCLTYLRSLLHGWHITTAFVLFVSNNFFFVLKTWGLGLKDCNRRAGWISQVGTVISRCFEWEFDYYMSWRNIAVGLVDSKCQSVWLYMWRAVTILCDVLSLRGLRWSVKWLFLSLLLQVYNGFLATAGNRKLPQMDYC